MKQPRTYNLKIRISPEQKAELQRIADSERRTLSQLVAIVLEDFLAAKKKGRP